MLVPKELWRPQIVIHIACIPKQQIICRRKNKFLVAKVQELHPCKLSNVIVNAYWLPGSHDLANCPLQMLSVGQWFLSMFSFAN